jgi:hypothetical protein
LWCTPHIPRLPTTARTGPDWAWNNFDFIIVAICWVPAGIIGNVNFLRLLRLMRLMKLVKKVKQLQVRTGKKRRCCTAVAVDWIHAHFPFCPLNGFTRTFLFVRCCGL